MQTGYDTMMQGGLSGVSGGGVRQTRFPHNDCLGIKNREMVENARMASGPETVAVAIESSGT